MRSRFLVVAALMLPTLAPSQEPPKPAQLTQADKDFFEQLFHDGLFDPKDAASTKVTLDRKLGAYSFFTWKKGDRYYHANGVGYTLPNTNTETSADLEAQARAVLPPKPDNKDEMNARVVDRMIHYDGGIADPPPLAFAAWCYRQGHDQIAAELLTELRRQADAQRNTRIGGQEDAPKDLRGRLKYDLTWTTFSRMLVAFHGRQDTLALALGERLQSHFSDGLTRYPQSKEVIADLKRRQKQGTLNPPNETKLPEGYATWTAEAKAHFWIKEFQEIDVYQMSQPGGVSFGGDERVRQVIALGEPALPALFDCLEKDDRLARVYSYWRNFHPSRKVHYVREGAWVAVCGILKDVPNGEAAGVPYNAPDPERYRLLGAAAKKFWLANRGKSPHQRWYETLCDYKIVAHRRYSSLESLLAVRDRWSSSADYAPSWPTAPAKLADDLAHFAYPTIAEAILKALDHDTAEAKKDPEAAQQPGKKNPAEDYNRNMRARHANQAEDVYLRGLVALGDRRVLPELRRREQAAPFRLRLKLAYALHLLGDSTPLAKLAQQLAEGKEPREGLALPPLETWDIRDIDAHNFIRILTKAGLPETEKALIAFANPEHPLHTFFKARLSLFESRGSHQHDFYSHPYSLAFFRERLKDRSPSGMSYAVQGNSITFTSSKVAGSTSLSGQLRDPAVRREKAESRVCDEVLKHLSQMIVGFPEYHPLFKDADARFEQGVKWFERHQYRHWTGHEARQLGVSSITKPLIPDLKPLGQPATAADVASGRAAFHLEGQGKRLEMQLPAWIVLKKDVHSGYVRRSGLVFQAEEAAGKKQYGALFNDGIRAVKEEDVDRVEAYETKPR